MALATEKLVKKALVSALNYADFDEISSDSHLKNDLQLDSMSSLMFLMKLEETIEGFYVDPETLEMQDLETVKTIVNYVDLQLSSKGTHVH